MKKTIALVLALLMTLACFAACNGNKTPVATPTPTPASTPDNSGGDAQPTNEPDAGYDEVSLMLATTYNENETGGKLIKHFTDYITEKSGGAITFNVKWGGTVAGTGEELSFVQSGAVDMSVLGQSQYSDIFPLLNFPGQSDGSQEKCMEYFKHIVYDNAETADIIQAQIEAQGVKMLGFTAGGGSAFAAKQDITEISELSKYKLGVGMNISAYESLGFNVQPMMPWDGYDSISKGVVDIAYMAIGPMIALNWHESAPFFVSTNIFSAGNYYTIGLDKWNSLSAEAQALFEEAMDSTAAYSVELNAEQESAAASALEAAGGKLSALNAEDTAAHAKALFQVAITDCRALAASGGCVDEMETILAACSEYLGIPIE